MKKIFILMLSALSVYAYAQEEQTEVAGAKQDKEWAIHSGEGYSIEYPSDWEVDLSGLMGVDLFLFSPIVDEQDLFRENVNILMQDLTGYDVTLDQYVDFSEEQIKTLITDSEIVSSERIKLNDTDCQKVIYTGKQGVYDLQYEQYYIVKNEKAFVLTLTCEQKSFDTYQEIGEMILNSFLVKP